MASFFCTYQKLTCKKPLSVKPCLKLSCDSRFQRAFTACCCVFKVIMLVWANQDNYFENANACS